VVQQQRLVYVCSFLQQAGSGGCRLPGALLTWWGKQVRESHAAAHMALQAAATLPPARCAPQPLHDAREQHTPCE
jgi:hypothetical protein